MISIQAKLPLTSIQQGILFHSFYDDDKAIYLSQAILDLPEQIHCDNLWMAWEKLFNCHDIFRSRLSLGKDGEAFIEILGQVKPDNTFHDYSDLTIKLAKQKISDFIEIDRQTPFDLHKAPLLRCNLFKLSNNKYKLVCTYHHILLCAPSALVALKDLFDFYSGTILKKNSSYSSFIDQYQQISECEGQQNYWGELFKNYTERALLPFNAGAKRIGSRAIRHSKGRLPNKLVSDLKEFSHKGGYSLNILCQAAWGILLAKYTDQNEAVFGTVRAYPRKIVKDTVGLFINTLPVRFGYKQETTICDVLDVLKTQHKGLKKYFATPLEKIVASTSLSQAKDLFFSVIDFKEKSLNEAFKSYGGAWSKRKIKFTTETNYPLLMEVFFSSGDLCFDLNFDKSLFRFPEIEQLLKHWQNILGAIVFNKESFIADIDILTSSERDNILFNWNKTNVPINEDESVLNLYYTSVKAFPTNVAVVNGPSVYTYKELDLKITRFSGYLRQFGLLEGDVVAVYLERSVELVISLISLFKLGLVYLPIDINSQKESVTYILKDSQTKAVITDSMLFRSTFDYTGIIIKPSSMDENNSVASDHARLKFVNCRDAYIIYTSGTTGMPKGVLGNHIGLLNRLIWMRRHYTVTEKDRILHKASISFDVSLWELLLPLISGSTLVLARKDGEKDFPYLNQVIKKQKITIVHFVPSLLRLFTKQNKLAELDSLREVICSGEVLPISTKNKVYQALPQVRLENLYGPTEASIDVSHWHCTPKSRSMCIGTPIDNIRLYVVNKDLQLMPAGVVGELYISGIGLAKEYVNNSEQTNEKFISLIIDGKKERCYKSGDLASWRRDGILIYHGRTDEQVKIQGVRLELAGMESLLNNHPKVHQAAVVVKEHAGYKHLIVYLILKRRSINTSLIDEYLSNYYPEIVLPRKIIILDEFPHLSSGKINKKLLMNFDKNFVSTSGNNSNNRNTTRKEAALIQAITEVLQLDNAVSPEDNYFALGGDSIKSVQIKTQLHQLGYYLDIREIFKRNKISSIAKTIKSDVNQSKRYRYQKFEMLSLADKTKIKAAPGVLDAWPLTALQEGMIFHSEAHGEQVYQDIFAYHFKIKLNKRKLLTAINNALNNAPILKSVFNTASYSRPIQLINKHIKPRVEACDYRISSDAEIIDTRDRFISSLKRKPLNIQQGAAIEIYILNFYSYGFYLIIKYHHALLDGRSMSLLLSLIMQRYKSSSFIIDELEDFNDLCPYVIKEKSVTSSGEYKEFWTNEVSSIREPCLVTDKLCKEATISQSTSKVLECDFSKNTLNSLTSLSKKLRVSLKSTLLSVHAIVLKILTGSDDLIIGSVESCRKGDIVSANSLGLFINTIPIVLKLENLNWNNLVSYVHSRYASVYNYLEYPLVDIIKLSNHRSIFDVLFYFTQFDSYDKLFIDRDLQLSEIIAHEKTEFPLAVNFYLNSLADLLKLRLVYDNNIFSTTQIKKISHYYQSLIVNLVDNANHLPLGNSFIDETEKHQLMKWGKGKQSILPNKNLDELLIEQAVRQNDNIAIIQGELQVTYKELLNKSVVLAQKIIKLTSLGEVVGVCLSRSPLMVVTLLAVMRTGRTFLPIDPQNPDQRIKYMLSNVGARLLITEIKFTDRFKNNGELLLLADSCSEESIDSASLLPKRHNNNVMYTIYTSGSTGQPKAVTIKHSAVINIILSIIDSLNLNIDETWISATSVSFDISILELFLPLFIGAKLHLTKSETIDGDEVKHILRLYERKVFQTTPSALDVLLNSGWTDGQGTKILSGGETLSFSVAHKALRNNAKLWNAYGPTETTIWSALYEITPDTLNNFAQIPIGKPILNTGIRIIGENKQLMPQGYLGELAVSGAGLLAGYCENGHMIDAGINFIDGKYFYSTGDIAYWDNTGVLMFKGRLDDQVKHHGVRINLKEIDSAILNISNVKQAIALISKDRLVAFYSTEHGRSIAAIKDSLQAILPKSIVPALFVHIDEWPLNINGKIDREKLPQCEAFRRLFNESSDLQSDIIDPKFVSIWISVLSSSRCGLHDDFFDIGGDSLLATRLIAKLNMHYHIQLPLRIIFDCPTPKLLIQAVDRVQRKNATLDLSQIITEPAENLQLSYGQKRLLYLEEKYPDTINYNIPILFKLSGRFNLDRLRHALHAVVVNHPILSYKITKDERHHLMQSFDETSIGPPLILHDIANNSLNKVQELLKKSVRVNTLKKFSLDHPPFMRVVLYRVTSAENFILFVVHHLIADSVSLDVLMKQLTNAYNDARYLPKKESRYVNYIKFYQEWRNGKEFNSQLAFWKTELENISLLPDTFVGEHNLEKKGCASIEIFDIPILLDKKIKTFCQKYKCTPYSFYLTTFYILLYRFTGSSDISLLSTVENRHLVDFDEIVGFMANTVIMRGELNSSKSFIDNLTKVADKVSKVLENSTISFSDVISHVFAEKRVDTESAFRIMFSYNDLHNKEGLLLDGLVVEKMTIDTGLALFDLQFSLERYADKLEGKIEYRRSSFSSDLIDHLCKWYLYALSIFVDKADEKIDAVIPALLEYENKQMRVWNNTNNDFTLSKSIFNELINDTRHNNKKIFLQDDSSYTLSDLSSQIRKVKAFLIEEKIEHGGVVALCTNFNISAIAVMLAMVELGVTYIPIDMSSPLKHVRTLLIDAKPQLIITSDSKAVETLADIAPTEVYSNIIERIYKTRRDEQVTGTVMSLDDLMYIIYTSGSTGKPKGVMTSYSGVLNTLYDLVERFYITDKDTLLSVTSIGFDLSVFDIFVPVICRARLVIPPEGDLKNPRIWCDLLIKHEVSIWNSTPSSMQLLLDYIDFAHITHAPRLRLILLSGDKITVQLVRNIQRVFAKAQVISLGGATEASIWSVIHQINNVSPPLPYGRPMRNQQLYVLNEKFEMLPPYIKGTIHIGGIGVAKGYWKDTQKTSSCFVHHNDFKTSLFRTGDIGYFDKDGLLYILGREDARFKVRGYRVDPSEIEKRVSEFGGIKHIVVDLLDDTIAPQLVAYVLPESDGVFDQEALFKYLSANLPSYMVPERYVLLERLPLTENHKVDRSSLKAMQASSISSRKKYPNHESCLEEIKSLWRDVLSLDIVDNEDNFFTIGGNSLLALQLTKKLNELGHKVQVADIFAFYTPQKLAAHLIKSQTAVANIKQSQVYMTQGNAEADIAIIGMAGRFPGSININEYWQNLTEGKESITHYKQPDGEVSLDTEHNVDSIGHISSTKHFDYQFFNISLDDARLIDPQQRLLMEVVWEGLENSGYIPEKFLEKIGLFVGTGSNAYAYHHLLSSESVRKKINLHKLQMLIDKDFVASRIAYTLGLTGPVMTINTACSTSLVAINRACLALLNNESDIMVAGASSLVMPDEKGYQFRPGYIFSPDGHCRALDELANGTVPSSGVAVVILKKLSRAIRDGDHIHAVIKGSAINNDGSDKPSYMAPSNSGQEACIKEALKRAKIMPRDVDYVELHATGTRVGDPIEFKAINKIYGERVTGPCIIGSVKSNIGHTDTASGIAGLIKTAFILNTQQVPPVVNFSAPNPLFELDASKFLINNSLLSLPNNSIRCAAISSFGIGGTNAHLILEKFEGYRENGDERSKGPYIVNFSSPSKLALDTALKEYCHFLLPDKQYALSDIASTLQLGRKAFPFRCSFVCHSYAQLRDALSSYTINLARNPDVTFILDGSTKFSEELINDLAIRFTISDDISNLIFHDDRYQFSWEKIKQYCESISIDGAYSNLIFDQIYNLIALNILFSIFKHFNILPQKVVCLDFLSECAIAVSIGALTVKEAIQLILIKDGLFNTKKVNDTEYIFKSNALVKDSNLALDHVDFTFISLNKEIEISNITTREYWCKRIHMCESSDPRNLDDYLGGYTLNFNNCITIEKLMGTVSSAWLEGIDVQWEALYQKHTARRIPLPGHVFQPNEVWITEESVTMCE